MINNADYLIYSVVSVLYDATAYYFTMLYFMTLINLLRLTYPHPDANCLQGTAVVAHFDYHHS